MKQLAIIDSSPTGIQIIKIMRNGDEEFWENNFTIAQEAIEFQQKYSELEKFNALHLNYVLNHCIKTGIINTKGIDLDPLIAKSVEKEAVRASWRWSKRKRLLKKMEYDYKKTKKSLKTNLIKRLFDEGWSATLKFLWQHAPQPIINLVNSLKTLNNGI